ncbi:MAG: hypothetical protein ACP5JL_04670, partial [bacterium]
ASFVTGLNDVVRKQALTLLNQPLFGTTLAYLATLSLYTMAFSLNGKLFWLLLNDSREDSLKGTVGVGISSQYKVSKDIDLSLEYFRAYQKAILSSIRLELSMKLNSSSRFTIGYDIRESIYQDNLLDNSYGKGVYLRIDRKF